MSDELMVLNQNAVELRKRFDGINNWIKDNPNTNPNFAEMINCIVKFGYLNTQYAEAYRKQGLEVKVLDENESHDISLTFIEMKSARNSLEEMIQLRKNSDFFKDENAQKFMGELLDKSSLGEYDRVGVVEDAVKERLLTQIAAVYFYIWDTKQREPGYVYDNFNELAGIKADFEQYKEKSGVDNPQFGNIVSVMIDRIENDKIMNAYEENSNKDEDSHLQELKLQALALKERFKNINGWIEQNMNTAPNFQEMIDCTIEYGRLMSRFNEYFRENGYPVLEGKEREATHYEIPEAVLEVKGVQEQLHNMMRLRGKHEFFKDKIAKNFIQELTYRAEIAEYDEPEDQAISAAKKDAMCMAAGVYFYIFDTRQREPWYKYDNEFEWNDLNNKYALYNESVGIQEEVRYDDHIYQGPQFGEVLEAMIDGIGKQSVFAENKTNVNENNIGSHK